MARNAYKYRIWVLLKGSPRRTKVWRSTDYRKPESLAAACATYLYERGIDWVKIHIYDKRSNELLFILEN